MDGRRKGSKGDSAAAAASKPAPAPHGRGGRDAKESSSSPSPSLGAGPAKNQASLLNEGKESAPRGRNTFQKRKEDAPQTAGSEKAPKRVEVKKKPSVSRTAQAAAAAGALETGEPGHWRAAATCRKSEESEQAGQGRLSRKSQGVAAQTGGSGEEPAGKKQVASQAQRERLLQADEADQARAADAAAAQKKRAARKAKGAPKEASDQKPLRSLREVLGTITLRQKAVSEASERVNKVRELLIKAIRKDPRFCSIEMLGTGSYYERLKISKPDEFDIMLKLPQLRFELESCDASASAGAFYSVKLKRNPGKENLSDFLDDNERLSAFRMLSALRNIIIKEVKKIETSAKEKVSVERKKPGCPAVTLLIGEPPSFISVDIILALEGGRLNQCDGIKDGPNIERWLGAKVKRDFRNAPLCLVPKNVKDGKCLLDCWRLSFSHIEKDIIMHHGNEKTCCESGGKKCCRKACLKLLKYLLELLKTKDEYKNKFDKFCSYHAKTAFFQACVKWPCDSEWLETNLDDCFEKFLDFFLDCLRNTELRHFFIPEFNFFSTDRIEKAKCKALAKVIESERNNKFPIFSLEL